MGSENTIGNEQIMYAKSRPMLIAQGNVCCMVSSKYAEKEERKKSRRGQTSDQEVVLMVNGGNEESRYISRSVAGSTPPHPRPPLNLPA